jgi:hypothetical protein
MGRWQYKRKTSGKSERKIIRDRIGRLHLEILRLKRGDRCEICGKTNVIVGRFHILTVGSHPRLEFRDENVLLSCWMPCHYLYHHNPEKASATKKRIRELRGDNYEDMLYEIERNMAQHNKLYLLALEVSFKKELESLKGLGN